MKKPRKPAKKALALTQTEQIDRELAARALQKRQCGEEPTDRELRALKRYEKQSRDERARTVPTRIPKSVYCEMTGRPAALLNKQQDIHGIPLRGAFVDLWAVANWIHDFLASNKFTLARAKAAGEDAVLFGPETPALEELRRVQVEIRKVELARLTDKLADRDTLHQALAAAAGILRNTGDRLQQEFGPKAFEIFIEGLDEAQRHINALFRSEQTAQDAPGAAISIAKQSDPYATA